MRAEVFIILTLWIFGANAADLPVYRDNRFIERIQTDDRGREVLSFVDYDGMPITGTVISDKENEHKTFQVVDGKAHGIGEIEYIDEKITQVDSPGVEKTVAVSDLKNGKIADNTPNKEGMQSQEDDTLILIERKGRRMQIPYEKGIIDGTVFVYDSQGVLLNEQIYGAGVKTVESFYRPNGAMYKYIRYFPNDRVVPLAQEEKLYDENGKTYAQIDTTFHDNGMPWQRQETIFGKDGTALSTFSTTYDLNGNMIDAAFSAERELVISEQWLF